MVMAYFRDHIGYPTVYSVESSDYKRDPQCARRGRKPEVDDILWEAEQLIVRRPHMPDDAAQPQQPEPDPALKRLEPLVGTWSIKGRTLGSLVDNVSARTIFEWLPGGFFLKQTFEADFVGMTIRSLELIGYDPSSDTFPSMVYSNLAGIPIPYRYDLRGKDVTITTDLGGGATMTGRISEDGSTFSGGWRPNPGAEGQGNVGYDFVGTRVK
jgi:hypothetical protein